MFDTHTPEMNNEVYTRVAELAARQGFKELAELRLDIMSAPERMAYEWGMIDMESAIVMKFACEVTKAIYSYNQPIAA